MTGLMVMTWFSYTPCNWSAGGVTTDNHRVVAPLNHDISAVQLTARDNMIHNSDAVMYLPRAAAQTWKSF